MSIRTTTVRRIMVALALSLGAMEIPAAPRTWTGAAGDSNWFNAVNWDGGVSIPADGDTVTIPTGASVVLTNQTAALAAFTITNATLTFKDTTNAQVAELRATDVFIRNLGTLTHVANSMTNADGGAWLVDGRVYVTCATFTVDAGGKINGNGLGYASAYGSLGFGPGASPWRDASRSGGAGHGGRGGNYLAKWDDYTGGTNYDNLVAPVLPGSGGANSTNCLGGGVIRINASGAVVVNGTISADATYRDDQHGEGAASGGSVYITCATLAGSGTISANGGDTSSRNFHGGGGGGRISVSYTDTVNQSADVPITFWAFGGYGNTERGEVGTLYISGSKFFPRSTMVGSYNLTIPGFTNWSPASLIVTNSLQWVQNTSRLENTAIRLPDGIQLSVGGNLIITSTNAILDLRNGAQLSVGGDMILTNGGQFVGYAGVTNGTATGPYGLIVSVTGKLDLATNCVIYPYSERTNGGAVKFSVGSFVLQPGAIIDADGKGYGIRPYYTAGDGYGPGKGLGAPGNYSGGGGNGGKGGDASATYTGGQSYGSSNAPIFAGSSGGSGGYTAGKGGGLVWIEAPSGTAQVDGTITADGYTGNYHAGGGGAGGSIYLTAKSISGAGALGAIGGAAIGGGYCGGGGGGRIAVWSRSRTWSGSPSTALTPTDYWIVTNGVSYGAGATTGMPGTIVWGSLPDLAVVQTNYVCALMLGGVTSLTLQATNSGLDTSDLYWSMTPNAGWLSCAPTGVIHSGQVAALAVTNLTTGLSAGQTYTGQVTVAASNAISQLYGLVPLNQTAQFVVTVEPQPQATRSPASITATVMQGFNPSNQVVRYWNSMTNSQGQYYTMRYAATSDVAWLLAATTGVNAGGVTSSIPIAYSTTTLLPAVTPYSGSAWIAASNTDFGQPVSLGTQRVDVTVTVVARPVLQVSQTTFALNVEKGDTPAATSFSIRNTSVAPTVPMAWTAVSDASWLTVNTSGVSTGEADTVSVTLGDMSAYSEGTYVGHINMAAVDAGSGYEPIGQVTGATQATVLVTVTAPGVPQGVTATDGAYEERVDVTWSASSLATGYEIWRSATNSTAGLTNSAANRVGTTSGTSYTDTSGASGTPYYYWVRALNRFGKTGSLSAPDVGARGMMPPLAVTATAGTYTDKVVVSWSAATGATGYRIYRNTLNSGSSAVVVGVASGTSYEDTTAIPGTLYYYWVAGTNWFQASRQSLMHSGYRNLSPPAGLSASDGTYAGQVVVTWTAADGAIAYEVWRSATANAGDAVKLGDKEGRGQRSEVSGQRTGSRPLEGGRPLPPDEATTARRPPAEAMFSGIWPGGEAEAPFASASAYAYTDTTATAGVPYWYWVKARGAVGLSGYGTGDMGWTGLTTALNPMASDGLYANKVSVVWTASSAADRYEVWRSPASGGAAALLLGASTGSTYDDLTAEGGILYSYWVLAKNTVQGMQWLSASDTGYRQLDQPAVTATDGVYSNQVRVLWTASSNAVSYDVYRGVTNDLFSAARVLTTTAREWNDTGASVMQPYYYWVQARNDVAASPFSVSDSGWRSLGGTVNRAAVRDYDGDMKSDVALYSGTTGYWTLQQSSAGAWSLPFGGSGYGAVSGDYDGDGKWDLALYAENTGTWMALLSGSRFELVSAVLGGSGYQPAPADYDGDGLTDPCVFSPATAGWYGFLSGQGYALVSGGIQRSEVRSQRSEVGGRRSEVRGRRSGVRGQSSIVRGTAILSLHASLLTSASSLPIMGDYDGDGKADPVTYDGATGVWQGLLSGSGYAYASAVFGGQGYTAVAGDFDGDGKWDPCVQATATGEWWALLSGSGYAVTRLVAIPLSGGAQACAPMPGDYDGDGKTDLAGYGADERTWTARLSASGATAVLRLGGAGSAPVSP